MCKETSKSSEAAYTQYLKKISDEFIDVKVLDVSEMFRYLMNFGSMLPSLQEHEFTEENFVHGCVSNAYVLVELNKDDKACAHIRGHSDVMVVKGFMGIISSACVLVPMRELIIYGKHGIETFLHDVELDIILTPTRANAFGNIIAMIFKKISLLIS